MRSKTAAATRGGMHSARAAWQRSPRSKSVEVVHWWTSGGEAAALKVLKDDMQKNGYGWKDSPVAGGGGDQARTVLRARVAAGNPPDAMQMLGFIITDYAEEGLLGDLTPRGHQGRLGQAWCPPRCRSSTSTRAIGSPRPVNIHRTNWIWANKKIFDELKITPPKTFDELLAAADKIKKAGYIPLGPRRSAVAGRHHLRQRRAVGRRPRVLPEGDDRPGQRARWAARPWRRRSSRCRSCAAWSTRTIPSRDWNLATAMVINGKAGMQIMGDWAKGEFLKAGKKPNVDFLLLPVSGHRRQLHVQLRRVRDVQGRARSRRPVR